MSNGVTFEITPVDNKTDRATVKAFQDEKLIAVDKISLHSHRSRAPFLKTVAEKTGLETNTLDRAFIENIDQLNAKRQQEPTEKNPLDDCPENIINEALEMLKNPDLFARISRDIEQIGIAGEKELCLTLYLVQTSRLLDKPLSGIVYGASASGKSYMIEQIARMMPPETVIQAHDITDEALYYLQPGELKNKIVLAGERIPLRKDIVDLLKKWMDERTDTPNTKIFPKLDSSKTSRMIQKDLKLAEVEYLDDSGRYADFHALRHTFITNLTKGGVSPRVAQSLARHSTITLTMDRYSHVVQSSERAALEVLPDIAKTTEIVQIKTGTDNLPVESQKTDTKTAHIWGKTAQKTAQTAYPNKHRQSVKVRENENLKREIENHKSFLEKKIGTDNQSLSVPVLERRRRDSNPRYVSAQRFSRPPP